MSCHIRHPFSMPWKSYCLSKQMLTVFHSSRLEKHPISILVPTVSFLQTLEDQTNSNGGNN